MASLLKKTMPFRTTIEGTVNGHYFKCTGKGEGNPLEGTQEMKIEVIEGGPLPFAFHILSTSCMYGSKAFIKYVSGIPDYFKQSLPEGFTWERTTTYEDGGFLTAHQDTSLDGDCLVYKVKILGNNFPADGPVMQNKAGRWEPSTEIVYEVDGVLRGQSLMALECPGGRHLTCHLHTTYRSKKPASALKMPGFHFEDHRIEILEEVEKGKCYKQYEAAVGRYCDAAPSKLGHN
nr:AsRed [synthetic construct]